MSKTKSSSLYIYVLVILVTTVWALAWPISKIGLQYMQPVWYTAARTVVATLAMFIGLLCAGKLKLPTRKDIPMILAMGIFQISLFLILLNWGLLYVPPGRSAILVYTTPLWVTPIAAFIFGEHISKPKFVGLLLGIGGIIALFNPTSFNWSDPKIVLGNILLVLCAISWAIAMLWARYGKWHSSALTLYPWQLLVATIIILIAAPIFEPHIHVTINTALIYTILYNGLLATAFGFLAGIIITKHLPVVTTSLFLLATPPLGLLFSNWMVGEDISINLIIAMILIISGLIVITLSNRLPK